MAGNDVVGFKIDTRAVGTIGVACSQLGDLDDRQRTPIRGRVLLQREAIDHGRKHPHVIGGRSLHAAMTRRESAPDIAAADHDRHLHSHGHHFFDLAAKAIHDFRGNVIRAPRRFQGFTAQFENDAAVFRLGKFGGFGAFRGFRHRAASEYEGALGREGRMLSVEC